MEIKKIKKIDDTQSRSDIIGSFEYLTDTDFQMKNWLNFDAAHCFSDSISWYAFDTLIEEFDLDEKTYNKIGQLLYDEEEARAIEEYCSWFLDLMNDVIGWEEPDEVYYKHSEWPKVVEGALKIRKLMAKKNKENGFWRQFDEDNGDVYDENNKGRLQLADEAYLK